MGGQYPVSENKTLWTVKMRATDNRDATKVLVEHRFVADDRSNYGCKEAIGATETECRVRGYSPYRFEVQVSSVKAKGTEDSCWYVLPDSSPPNSPSSTPYR